jgi:hypothetical protein
MASVSADATKPGDLVFSFADGYIRALGIIASHGYEAPKPHEFGQVGAYWDRIGWRASPGSQARGQV